MVSASLHFVACKISFHILEAVYYILNFYL